MTEQNAEFLKNLIEIFKIEAEEHIANLSANVINLEKSDSNDYAKILEILHRETHSLKGASRSVNIPFIERICHSLETLFGELKSNKITVSATLCTQIHKAIDYIAEKLKNDNLELNEADNYNVSMIVNDINNAAQGNVSKRGKSIISSKSIISTPIENNVELAVEKTDNENPIQVQTYVEKSVTSEHIRISNKKLNTLMNQIEELQSVKLTIEQTVSEIASLNAMTEEYENEKNKLQLNLKRLKHLNKEESNFNECYLTFMENFPKVNDFIDWSQDYQKNFQSKLESLEKTLFQFNLNTKVMINNIFDDLKKLQLFPFATLLGTFPKLIRDIALSQNKDIDWKVKGEEIEIDKRIMDEIKDPLIHIIRNCISHGIETSEIRLKNNKTSKGHINCEIEQIDSGTLRILISDDGAGINFTKLKQTLEKLGIMSQEQSNKKSKDELIEYLFYSGVSTANYVSDISGRGLGMAIIKEKIEKLNGDLLINSAENQGTTFIITLPINLANFRGTLITANNQELIIPSNQIEQIIRIKKEEIHSIENQDTIEYKNKAVPLVKLADVLGIKSSKGLIESSVFNIVVINSSQKQIAYVVDEVLMENEILVKNLGKQLLHIPNIAGGTIIGGGKVVLVINVPELIRTTISSGSQKSLLQSGELSNSNVKDKKILVVEDSITARTLLKNLLETAGFLVTVAVDGLDALTKLKTEEFDLVVSDIEMPRMNGFELTAKIRDTKSIEEIPIILVTSLDSREDKERGIEVGANAYIVKGSFDQFHLIEVVRRLI